MFSIVTEAKKKPFGNGLFWEVTAEGTLIISGRGDMPDFEKDLYKLPETPWKTEAKKGQIKNAIIEEGITSIGNYAFCFSYYKKNWGVRTTSYIKHVQFPTSLKRIGHHAFYKQSSFDNIELNSGLEIIDYCAFAETFWRKVIIPSSVYKLGWAAFSGSWVEEVILSDNIEIIENSTFSKCKKLKNIKLPSKLKSIGLAAFYECENLHHIDFPTQLQVIGENAFMGCYIDPLNIPNNVVEIGKDAFPNSGLIEHLPNWVTENNCEKFGIKVWKVESYRAKALDKNGKILLSAKKGRESSKETDEYDGSVYYKVNDNGNLGIMDDQGVWHVNTNRGYKQIKSFRADSGKKFYIVSKSSYSGPYGLIDDNGGQIVPMEMDEIKHMGNRYVAFKVGNYWGVMTTKKQIIVPTSRNYNSVGRYISTLNTFSFTKTGYRGECDGNGKEISLTKVETPVVPKTPSTKTSTSHSSANTTTPKTSSSTSSSSTASSNNSSSSNNSRNNTTTIHVEHHRDPVPVQEWVPCGICYGDGKCNTCFGTGSGPGSGGRCISCGYSGKCRFCNGQEDDIRQFIDSC